MNDADHLATLGIYAFGMAEDDGKITELRAWSDRLRTAIDAHLTTPGDGGLGIVYRDLDMTSGKLLSDSTISSVLPISMEVADNSARI